MTLSCTSGFAIQWLLPRLADFERRYPKIEIQIGTTNRRVDLLSEGIDFAVRHGVGGWPELQAYRLLDDDLIPVCSPQLIAPRRSLAGAGDLLQYPLLHDEHREDWALWCEAVGLEPDRARRGPVFTDSNGVTEAAFAGMGMALLRRSFIASALTQGGWLILWRSPSPVRWPIIWFTTRPRCWRLPTAVFATGCSASARLLLRRARSEGALSDKDPYA
ncbi:LysR substrate-binding domain-containing protein [Klebsiella variicola subsp. variicola]|nr:LysR substrate-binding domain-containing protein [Klebsiella variicola subsp. variicola]